MMGDGGSDWQVGQAGVPLCCVLLVVALLGVVPVATAAPATGTNATQAEAIPNESAFVVALGADGSARTTLAVTFDLQTDSERAAFDRLRENTTAREVRRDQFATRLRGIADRADATTERDMTVRNASVSFAERGSTGVVALSATWERLAAREGDRLVVSDPFDSGFSADRTFRVVGPDDYELATVTPSPTDRTRTAATWDGGTTFDRFTANFAPAGGAPGKAGTADGDGQQTGTAASGPGFGVGVALLALLCSAVLVGSQGRNR